MTADPTSFLTYYLRSLLERTRVEKASTKYGFDWVIYNLGLAEDLIPCRLPFLRGSGSEISKTKTEYEFGIDCAFLSADRRTLTIFVLKDEVLTNANWKAHDFDADIRAAAAVDLRTTEFSDVQAVRVILAYNKDEDQAGITHFERLTASLGTKIHDTVSLTFERWNLTTLTIRVKGHLLTPALLPQSFYSLFSYICSQYGDFRHGSEEWDRQLVPNWRRFLDQLLKGNPNERSIRLLPVALIILHGYGASNPTSETGYIDLIEWTMLSAWQVFQTTTDEKVRLAVFEMWSQLYLGTLERYYDAHAPALATLHSLEVRAAAHSVQPVVSAIIAHWHLARLGLLAMGFSELLNLAQVDDGEKHAALQKITYWLVGLLNANPAAKRPLLDLHHIELALVWRAFWRLGRHEDIHRWLEDLHHRLVTRRLGMVEVPFIEGESSLELVLEHVATGKRPPEYCDQSSLLLLFLLEICLSLPPAAQNDLMEKIYTTLVLGCDSSGEPMPNCKSIDLLGWHPPADWADRVLIKSLAEEGESQTIGSLDDADAPITGERVAAHISEFILQSRRASPLPALSLLPGSVIALACLKHGSPLPPEFWRAPLFGPADPAPPDAPEGPPA